MTPPSWVRERDGTLVPFDPDKISRALFATSECLGRPDAFLARELADGVIHFLAAGSGDTVPTTAEIKEIVVKVVRELGQPDLAQAFAERVSTRARHGERTDATVLIPSPAELSVPCLPDASRWELTAACLRAFALQVVFARDLAAAHRDGLVTLGGLTAPFELEGCVLDPATGTFEAVAKARRHAANFVAIDGPEYTLAARPEEQPAYLRDLDAALRCTDLRAVLNLNTALAPSWADDVASGPLFTSQSPAAGRARFEAVADQLLEALLSSKADAPPAIEVNWHLGENDFRPDSEGRLLRVAGSAVAGAPLAFVFDRPRRPVSLAPGMDRENPAILLSVQLQLPALATQVAGHADAPARFVQKLGSLVRLSLSAAVQKRDFLRKRCATRPSLARGFLLDRARLIVQPVGLDRVVATLLGQPPADSPETLEFARRIVERLRDVVSEDGRSRHLEVGIDGTRLADPDAGTAKAFPPKDIKSQLRVAAVLHEVTPLGTIALRWGADVPPPPEEIVTALHWLWKRSQVGRVQLANRAQLSRQLTIDS
jgi:hypothetical protein